MFELENHETLVIDRRRRGENQTEAAKRWGISQPVYSLWERNKHSHVPRTMLYGGTPTTPFEDDPSELEICFIKRRRAKLTQKQLGDIMGYSEEWIKRMERGEVNAEPLIKYWVI